MTTTILERPLTTEVIDRTGCPGSSRTGRHGDANAYANGCRCADALVAGRRYRRELNERNVATGKVTAKTRATFSRANRRPRDYAPGTVDAQPTADRLRILAGLGYDWPQLADQLDWPGWDGITDLMALAHARTPEIRFGISWQVRILFDDLAIRGGQPAGDAADRAIEASIANGWGLVDIEVINRALAVAVSGFGSRPTFTKLEKQAVVHIGAARGLPTYVLIAAARMSNGDVNAALAA